MQYTVTYEKVRYFDPDTGKNRTAYFANPSNDDRFYMGRQVNRFGDDVRKDRETFQVIDQTLMRERTPMQMNNFYGELEEQGQDPFRQTSREF